MDLQMKCLCLPYFGLSLCVKFEYLAFDLLLVSSCSARLCANLERNVYMYMV